MVEGSWPQVQREVAVKARVKAEVAFGRVDLKGVIQVGVWFQVGGDAGQSIDEQLHLGQQINRKVSRTINLSGWLLKGKTAGWVL